MDTNEKFSDVLQILHDNVDLEYDFDQSILSFLVKTIQYIEKDKYLSSILTFENIDIVLEQFMFIKIKKDAIKINAVVRDALYLLKSDLLYQNLKNSRRGCFQYRK